MNKQFATASLIGSLLMLSGCIVQPLEPAAIEVGAVIEAAPPPLPVYVQPVIPGPGYIWTPGYWAWDGTYYWVPGTWVLPPAVGLLWTPGWWGWANGGYRWHTGYWGPEVGFYGGIDYGFGYFGIGYVGGRWRDGVFYYNRAVNNVNVTVVRNVYIDRTVIREPNPRRASYNGGTGGTTARPTAAERARDSRHRMPATSSQVRQQETAAHRPDQRFNSGRPAVLATPQAEHFDNPEPVRGSRGLDRPSGSPARSETGNTEHPRREERPLRPERPTRATEPEPRPGALRTEGERDARTPDSSDLSRPERRLERRPDRPAFSGSRDRSRSEGEARRPETRPAQSSPDRSYEPRSSNERSDPDRPRRGEQERGRRFSPDTRE